MKTTYRVIDSVYGEQIVVASDVDEAKLIAAETMMDCSIDDVDEHVVNDMLNSLEVTPVVVDADQRPAPTTGRMHRTFTKLQDAFMTQTGEFTEAGHADFVEEARDGMRDSAADWESLMNDVMNAFDANDFEDILQDWFGYDYDEACDEVTDLIVDQHEG